MLEVRSRTARALPLRRGAIADALRSALAPVVPVRRTGPRDRVAGRRAVAASAVGFLAGAALGAGARATAP